MIQAETIHSICGGDATAIERLRGRIRRNASAWVGFEFDRARPLSEEEAERVRTAIADKKASAKDADGKNKLSTDADAVKPAKDADKKPSTDGNTDASTDRNISVEAYKEKPGANVPPAGFKKAALWAVMLAPAVASFQNVYYVTGDILHETSATLLLTIAFTCAPFVFVYVGLKSRAIVALTAILIALEAFCNTVRIYGGLTGFGHRGNPTRFLGIVCELFNSGTYITATVLAGIFSSLAACVMYAAYSQVRK